MIEKGIEKYKKIIIKLSFMEDERQKSWKILFIYLNVCKFLQHKTERGKLTLKKSKTLKKND